MLWRLIPVLLMLLGLGAGVGAGFLLRPPAPEPAEDAKTEEAAPEQPPDYVKLHNQFIVPVVEKGRVSAMVILALTVQVSTGSTANVFAVEPKLRDVLLQVLFDHANAGGFRGSFTDGDNLVLLRRALNEAAVGVLGDIHQDVLITDIVRQDS